jgi:hypothetical protein
MKCNFFSAAVTLLFIAGCAHNSKQPATGVTVQKDSVLSSVPQSNDAPKNIAAFIPNGYSIFDSTKGDLNLDALTDMILILKNNEEDSVPDDTVARPLLILTGQKDGSYKLEAKNDSVVYTADMGGAPTNEPFDKVVIHKGNFSVKHSGGAGHMQWESSFDFSYSPKDNNWYLSSAKNTTHITFVSDGTESDASKTLTGKDFGKILFHDFNFHLDKFNAIPTFTSQH